MTEPTDHELIPDPSDWPPVTKQYVEQSINPPRPMPPITPLDLPQEEVQALANSITEGYLAKVKYEAALVRIHDIVTGEDSRDADGNELWDAMADEEILKVIAEAIGSRCQGCKRFAHQHRPGSWCTDFNPPEA